MLLPAARKKHSPLGSIQKKCGILTCGSPAKHKQAIHIQKHAIKLRGSGDPFVAGDPNAERPTQLIQKETYLLMGVGPNTPKQTLWAKSKVPMVSSRPRHIFRTQTAQSLKDPKKELGDLADPRSDPTHNIKHHFAQGRRAVLLHKSLKRGCLVWVWGIGDMEMNSGDRGLALQTLVLFAPWQSNLAHKHQARATIQVMSCPECHGWALETLLRSFQ